jgi:hypothetical protein
MCLQLMPRNKRSKMSYYRTLYKAIVLAAVVAASLAAYFIITVYVLPQSFQQSLVPRRPEAAVTDVGISAGEIALGESFTISVTGTNRGEEADMQIVSVGFPNMTRLDGIRLLEHNFRQTPLRINPGDSVGSGYTGIDQEVAAQYPSIEAFSRPWDSGAEYRVTLEVEPEAEGEFLVFVKSVALPHSWDGAHWPQNGVMDYQQEYVEVYSVQVVVVAKP